MAMLLAHCPLPADYQYFLCGKYSIAISLLEPEVISIFRVLDGRTDYATSVFGELTARTVTPKRPLWEAKIPGITKAQFGK